MLPYENMEGQGKTSTESLESTLDILSELEVLEAIHLYDRVTASNVAKALGDTAIDTKDKDTMIKIVKKVSLDEMIVDTINKYESESYSITSNLIWVTTHTGSKDAVIESARAIRRYKVEAASSVAFWLSRIAKCTNDKDTVIECAKVIGKYGEETASRVAFWLGEIAILANDKDAVKWSARAIEEYREETAIGVAGALGSYAYNATYKITDCKERVMRLAKMMLLDEIVDTVGKYKREAANSIALVLSDISLNTEDKDAVKRVAKIMSLDEIVNTVGKYSESTAGNVAHWLSGVARHINDKDAVLECARVIGKYGEETASSVARALGDTAVEAKNKDAVMKIAKIMSLDEIVDTVGKYEEEVAEDVVYWLSRVDEYINDRDTVIKIARVIGKYDGADATGIARALWTISEITQDNSTVIESARTIGRYNGETAYNISCILNEVAVYAGRNLVMRACGVINKIGNGILNVLNAQDVKEIIDKGLDSLIDGKKSFDSVAAYIKAKGELPLPTKDNINRYDELISRRLSNKYSITEELGMNQLLMLYSVKKEERKGLAKLLNESHETNRKTYSINVKDEKDGTLDGIDRSRLPYLSVIAVIGSRDKPNEEKAMDAVSKLLGDKAVNRARNSFNSKYRNLKKEIIDHMRNEKLEDAIRLLKETGDESINDVMSVSDSRDLSAIKGSNLLNSVESNNPLDYDSRVQMACVYLPRDYDEGVEEYCKDKRFHLIRYDVNGTTLGSAICYLENGNFLVDSVEGHRTFNKPGIFNAVYRDLTDRARDLGAEKIIFSTGGINRTPMAFIESLKKRGIELGSTSMKLDTHGYLEAERPAKGYIVKLK